MIENVAGFDWDRANTGKCEKCDIGHSDAEERFIAVGKTSEGRGLFVGFTFRLSRRGRLIRPITARFMHKREIEKYEKAVAKTKK